jgi:hypothetical protein
MTTIFWSDMTVIPGSYPDVFATDVFETNEKCLKYVANLGDVRMNDGTPIASKQFKGGAKFYRCKLVTVDYKEGELLRFELTPVGR